jgi:hypothetical protein
MQTGPRSLRMNARERVAASYVTGPVGHFVAGSIDLGLAVARLLIARARRTLRRRPRAQRFSE